ncbi:MAG: DUF692 domain-containing protein [Candidatus Thiodiazotropha sp.]
MNRFDTNLHGAGLGLRRSLMGPLAEAPANQPEFLEVAPENWIGVGGRLGRQFRAFTERYPFVLHGLSLSLGGPMPIDRALVSAVGELMQTHGITVYSEHLSYCSDQGQLYDLMPIPFTEAAVAHVAARIGQVQDMLGQRIAIENVSYYAAPGQEMSELEFLRAVLEAADCDLLLDVNNVYVNAHNHGYDPLAFIRQLPGERIAYLHVAGHYRESDALIIDTHGAEIIDPVWELLEQTYDLFGTLPTLLERDFNLPPLPDLLGELAHIRSLQLSQEAADVKCA